MVRARAGTLEQAWWRGVTESGKGPLRSVGGRTGVNASFLECMSEEKRPHKHRILCGHSYVQTCPRRAI